MNELQLAPIAASEYAGEVDKLFWVMNALTVVFTIIVIALIAFLAARYRKGSNVDRSNPTTHNTLLEMTWTLPALVLGLGVFTWSSRLFADVYQPPKNAREVFVIGKQWMWHAQHSDGTRENNEIHVPVNSPVKLSMISQDVIHAFYVPEFRIQRHAEPGRYTNMWFTPTRVGKYRVYCNIYCGTQHSEMGGWVVVQSREDFEKWQAGGGGRPFYPGGISATTGDISLAQQGATLFKKYQCASCHADGPKVSAKGASLVGLYKSMRQLADGSKVLADEGYIRSAILNPNDVRLANSTGSMPAYRGSLSESEVIALIAYIKEIGTGKPLEGGSPDSVAPAANTNSQQWRFMYGGEQYQ